MTKKLNLKFFLTLLLSLFICSATWAKRKVVEELVLAIHGYAKPDQKTVPLLTPGELVLTLSYWDTFSTPDNNNYSLDINGYSDSSRSNDHTVFHSHISGASPKNVRRGDWNNAAWWEGQEPSGMKAISFTINEVWDTRFVLDPTGHIVVTYGRLNDEGRIVHAKSVIIRRGGEEIWNKLEKFLRNAHNHNIGEPW